jgi:hypothetical protein
VPNRFQEAQIHLSGVRGDSTSRRADSTLFRFFMNLAFGFIRALIQGTPACVRRYS